MNNIFYFVFHILNYISLQYAMPQKMTTLQRSNYYPAGPSRVSLLYRMGCKYEKRPAYTMISAS
jgi:hypothetical protein